MGADTRPLLRGLFAGQDAISRFAARANGMAGGAGMGAAALAGGVAGLASAGVGAAIGLAAKAGAGIMGAITAASDLNETLAKTGTLFGPAADQIIGKAGEMSKRFGTSKTEFIDAAAGFGGFLMNAGKGQDEAAKMGNQLAVLGLDLASFENKSNGNAFAALTSALKGEFDPIETFHVSLSAATVADEALRMGLAKTKGEIDDNAKKTATLSLIMRQTGKAQGDLSRTASGAANQFRQAGGGLENFGLLIGQLLLPAVQVGTGAFNELLGSMLDAFEGNKGMFEGWAAVLTGAVEKVAVAVRNWPDVWELAKLAIQEKFINLGEYLLVFPANLGIIADYIANNWTNLLIDAFNAVGSTIHNLGTNLGNLFVATQNFLAGEGWSFDWTPLLDGFKATAEKLPELIQPELTSLADERDQVMARIAGKEAKRAEDMKAATAGPAAKAAEDIGKKAEKGDQYHATAAVELGSKEFSSAIVKHANGGAGDDKPIKIVAKNSQDHLTEARTQTQIWRDIKSTLGAVGQLNAAVLA